MGNVSSKNTIIDATNGAAHVSANGAVTAVSGTAGLYTLLAATAAGSGDAATQFITDTTGWKGFTVDISTAAPSASEALMICWSVTADDEANTTAELDLLRPDIGTPDGVNHPNCAVVTINTSNMPVILWDGTDTIKTISVASQATTAHDVVIQTDDHVILFLNDKQKVKEVERLFQVGLNFFG